MLWLTAQVIPSSNPIGINIHHFYKVSLRHSKILREMRTGNEDLKVCFLFFFNP